jgi:hypothetical protein
MNSPPSTTHTPLGFSPSKVLPVVIDVGTNNEALRNDPHYVGLRSPRITGPEYFEIIDEVGRVCECARLGPSHGASPARA